MTRSHGTKAFKGWRDTVKRPHSTRAAVQVDADGLRNEGKIALLILSGRSKDHRRRTKFLVAWTSRTTFAKEY